MKREANRESGQVLIIVAFAMFTVLLGAAAIAIDLGNGQLQKRRLQNITDAAALAAGAELARGGTDTAAAQAAENVVLSNTGGSISLFAPPPGVTGTGTNLSHGVEINGSSVRVALTRRVGTFFGGVLGAANIPVRARSMTSNVAAGQVLPIAVKRFSGGDTTQSIPTPSDVYDNVAIGTSGPLTAWPSPLTAPTSAAPAKTDWYSYDPAVSGRVVPLIGADAITNVGTNQFNFFVHPDIRNLVPGPAQYFNGIDAGTNAQTLKDTASSYIYPMRGYPGPLPRIGEQIAALNGAATPFGVQAMRKAFEPGTVVTAMVYDGTLHRKPDFSISVSPSYHNTSPDTETSAYTISLTPLNGFGGNVELRVFGLEDTPSDWGTWSFDGTSANTPYTAMVSTSTPTSVPLKITPNYLSTGERSAMVVAFNAGTGVVRIANVKVGVDTPDTFSVWSDQVNVSVPQGGNKPADLNLFKHGSNPSGDVSVYDGSVEWAMYDPDTGSLGTFGSFTPAGVQITRQGPTDKTPNPSGSAKLTVRVSATAGAAVTPGRAVYIAKFPVKPSSGSSALEQDVYLAIRVAPPGPAASDTTDFVVILGYADFVISYAKDDPPGAWADSNITTWNPNMDSSTVYAYAVSGLWDPYDPSYQNKKLGMRPRLVPWN